MRLFVVILLGGFIGCALDVSGVVSSHPLFWLIGLYTGLAVVLLEEAA